jgi:hypothetical protein
VEANKWFELGTLFGRIHGVIIPMLESRKTSTTMTYGLTSWIFKLLCGVIFFLFSQWLEFWCCRIFYSHCQFIDTCCVYLQLVDVWQYNIS